MYHKHQTEGLILKSYDSGDSNKKLALLTQDLGLIYAHVQGARALASKLRGSIQEFSLGKYTLVKGSGGWKLVGAHAERNIFREFQQDEEKLKIIINIFNLVRSLVGEGAQAENIHASLKIFLEQFASVPEEYVKFAEYATLIKILYELGYVSPQKETEVIRDSFSLSSEKLASIGAHKEKIVNTINQAFSAAHLKM